MWKCVYSTCFCLCKVLIVCFLYQVGIQNYSAASTCQSQLSQTRSDYGKLFVVLVIIGAVCMVIITSGFIYICWQRRLPAAKSRVGQHTSVLCVLSYVIIYWLVRTLNALVCTYKKKKETSVISMWFCLLVYLTDPCWGISLCGEWLPW